ncbi:unnamed protein product [Miscanthus lutarioriparius]|uniref:Uncharacterized protein n=1 Tax=Miscanthus lutarioriparius TaxID=422564 RepID=A0A811P4L7_9POAL|nr:unnamed protein product [Miscanthus lutarioriparius]
MAANLQVPRLRILLFVFLVVHVHVPASHAIPPSLPTTYDSSICSESLKCGGVNISYPFYLADGTTDHGYKYSCGYTDLKISCQVEGPTETPVISLGGEKYNVQHIFYDIHTIILADSDVFVGGSCPAVGHNVSFDESPPDASPGDSFVLTPGELDTGKHLEQELATNCSKVVTVPVIGDVLRAAASNLSNFTSGGYGDVLKRGFELECSRITADQCQQCERSEGHCAYNPNREFLACLCDGGKVGNPDCKHIA